MIFLQNLDTFTAETILGNSVLCEVMEEEDEILKTRLLISLLDRAQELGVKTKLEKLISAYKKEKNKFNQLKKSNSHCTNITYRQTNFGDEYTQLYCGDWIADLEGIRTLNPYGNEILVCYHPILLIKRYINTENGKEKIKLAYKKGVYWKEIVVEKVIIASASKIVSLSDYGISVTSENARYLVRYLSDIENMNIDIIDTQKSTSKLGWNQGEFVPYATSIVFDNEYRFKDTYNSIHREGTYNSWINILRDIRKSGRFEPKIFLAGSFASALVEPLNVLPFVINLWGETGKGKTVAIMLAASVWANPSNHEFITDPKSTTTALELRMDFLNNMPMLIDDMAQLKDNCNGNFSELIYLLCSGKGKDRSNTNLGLNRSTSWRNIILTNGEHSLVTEAMQGGAVNRIIDVEIEEGYIFENGNAITNIIKQNYGFAGMKFIQVIQSKGFDYIRVIQHEFFDRIKMLAKQNNIEIEEKQSLPMSLLLTADKIATDYIFNDGEYLDFNKCFTLLKKKEEVSENERAYEFIKSEIAINMSRFIPYSTYEDYKGEIWGVMEDGYVIIINNIFQRICDKGNFSYKSFLSWANKHGLIESQSGKNTKTKRLGGTVSRCVWLKTSN